MTLAMTRSTVVLPAMDELRVNTLRFLAVDMLQKAKSGHPGTSQWRCFEAAYLYGPE